jgi:hypothetical protein
MAAKATKRSTRSGEGETVKLTITLDGESRLVTVSRSITPQDLPFKRGTVTVACRDGDNKKKR